jgi:hypothetical protein
MPYSVDFSLTLPCFLKSKKIFKKNKKQLQFLELRINLSAFKEIKIKI